MMGKFKKRSFLKSIKNKNRLSKEAVCGFSRKNLYNELLFNKPVVHLENISTQSRKLLTFNALRF